MQCSRCKTTIEEGDAHDHLGQMLCEDCYMDDLSPVRTCDPWAVHSARTFVAQAGNHAGLTDLQTRILTLLKESGGIEPSQLVHRIGGHCSERDLEREFAALRHMERARAEKRGDKIFWRLW
jgi:hypothetical protein